MAEQSENSEMAELEDGAGKDESTRKLLEFVAEKAAERARMTEQQSDRNRQINPKQG